MREAERSEADGVKLRGMKKAIGAIVLGAAAALGAGGDALITSQQAAAAKEITPELLRAHVRFLSSDLLEGRGPATRGDALAEAYIQSQMEAMGVKPGAPGGGWIQRVPLVGIKPSVPAKVEFRSAKGALFAVSGGEFVAFSGVQKPESRIENAELVFVGYGIVAPEYQWDDYRDADLTGKVLLMMNNDPEDDPKLFAGKTRLWYGRWDYKYMMAAKKGAVGAIIIHTTPSAGYGWQVVQTSWSGELFELPDDGSPRIQIKAWATEDLSRKIAEIGGQNLDLLRASAQTRSFRPVPLGVRMSCAFTNTIEQKESGNVIGMIPGARREALEGSRRLHGAPRPLRHQGRRQGALVGSESGRHLQRRARQCVRGRRDPGASPARFPTCRLAPAARSTLPSWRGRSRACSDPSTWRSTRRSRREGSPPTSTSTRRAGSAARATSR